MIWGIARYEMKMQLRSLVFWLALVVVGLMFKSELIDEPYKGAKAALSYQQNRTEYISRYMPSIREQVAAQMEQRLVEGFPAGPMADIWSDRMQIVFAFVTLFAAAFVFERDRVSKAEEALLARPVDPQEYLIGKWIGVAVPVLVAAFLSMLAAVFCHAYIQRMLDLPWSAWPYLRNYLVLMVPTVGYSAVVVLTLTAWLPRSVVAIPAFLIYEVLGGVAPLRPKGWFDPTMFIARTENLGYSVWSEGIWLLLANRLFYVALTGVLLWWGARLYRRRVARGEAA